jgi:hypothetical protein
MMNKTIFNYNIDSQIEDKIFNPLSTMCVWNLLQYDNEHVGKEKDGFIKEMYPWLDYLIMMTFTGGKSYNNWYSEDTEGNPIYDFTKPLEVIQNVIRGGVKPFIVIGQTPNQLSTHPDDFGEPGTDWGNRYAPKDFDKYFDYIKAFAKVLVEKFGKSEIKTWKFRLMTEWDDCYDAVYWWNETIEVYFKLYDYTLAALSSEIGDENLYYGPGNVKELNGNIRELKHLEAILDHCAFGTNLYTGKKGSKCDHISISSYYSEVDVEIVAFSIKNMLQLSIRYQCLNIKEVGFGEAGYIFDIEMQRLHCAQGITEDFASVVARIFDFSNSVGKAYFANWEYLTDKCNYDIDLYHKPYLKTPAANVAGFISKMLNKKRLIPNLVKRTDSANLVGSISAYDVDLNVLQVLIYNHNSKMGDQGTEIVEVSIDNLINSNNIFDIKSYRVDGNNGNFSSVWLKDSENIERETIIFDMGTKGNSKYDTPILLYLDDVGKKFYFKRKTYYKELSEKIETNENFNINVNNRMQVCLSLEMPHHSVSLLEITIK